MTKRGVWSMVSSFARRLKRIVEGKWTGDAMRSSGQTRWREIGWNSMVGMRCPLDGCLWLNFCHCLSPHSFSQLVFSCYQTVGAIRQVVISKFSCSQASCLLPSIFSRIHPPPEKTVIVALVEVFKLYLNQRCNFWESRPLLRLLLCTTSCRSPCLKYQSFVKALLPP